LSDLPWNVWVFFSLWIYFWVLLVSMKVDMFIVEHIMTIQFFWESRTQWTHIQPWSSSPSFLSLYCNARPSSSFPQQKKAFLQKFVSCQMWPLLATHELCRGVILSNHDIERPAKNICSTIIEFLVTFWGHRVLVLLHTYR